MRYFATVELKSRMPNIAEAWGAIQYIAYSDMLAWATAQATQPNGTRPGPLRCATWVPQGLTAGVPAICDRGIQKGPVRYSRRFTPDGNRLDTAIKTRRVPRR